MSVYRAVVVQSDPSGRVSRGQVMLNAGNLPENDLLIQVKYSALNYFDALVLDGRIEGINYPLVPGIDAAGVVVSSRVPEFHPGDEVLVTGYELGINIPGSFGGYISVPAQWAIPIPMGLNMKSAMALGTAGIAAGIGILDLANTGVVPEKHRIAVTGASCDMGAVAAALIAYQGYKVTAYVENKGETAEYVSRLGVDHIAGIEELKEADGRVIMPPIYDGAFDTMGDGVLSAILKYMNPNSTAVVAGYTEDMRFDTSLHPFILRAVNVTGINAIGCSSRVKTRVWQKLSSDWKVPQLDWLCTEISLEELEDYIPRMLNKQVKGRIVINHSI